MQQKFISVAAWACLLFIVYATFSSAGERPELTVGEPWPVVLFERFGAYAMLGLLFCLAHPRRLPMVCLLVPGSALLLELLQTFIPDRHARISDAIEKFAGGVAGIFLAVVLMRLLEQWRRSSVSEPIIADAARPGRGERG